jgi:predicted alpha-1,2-mannosidase
VWVVISCSNPKQSAEYVNPFICTQGDHGQWLPAALVPFGKVELCPDTYPGSLTGHGDLAHSGYDYSDLHARGFSHLHRGSSGGGSIYDRAGILSIVPFTGEKNDTFYINPVLEIDKASEKAQAGYYSVRLAQDDIKAELTATQNVGIHRYTFPSGSDVRIFLNTGNRSLGMLSVQKDDHTIEGLVNGYYFVLKSKTPVKETIIWENCELTTGKSLGGIAGNGIVCDFGKSDEKLLIKVGISFTGIDAAYQNLNEDCPGWDFDQLKEDAFNAWNEVLSSIEVKGKNEEDKTIFYTALYHTCFLPVVYSDVTETYPGLDCKTHKAKGYKHYGGYSFWDSFRTKYPLYSLFQPAVYKDIVCSLRDLYEQADNWGPFPDNDHPPHGILYKAHGKDGCSVPFSCRHEHMLMVMTDAYMKNLFPVPLKEVYPYIRKEALLQMPERYDTIGFIPARPDQTGEYCWDSWCVAQLARELGYQSDYDYFMKRSHYWKNTWDSSIRFFRARSAEGDWLDFPDDPRENREKYTYEGSKWHWRWNVLHDLPGLIDVFGGKEAFVKELAYFFDHNLYTAGNQIDLQAPFLFNDAGAPWLTQKWVRKLLTEPVLQLYGTHDFFPEPMFGKIYKNAPDGYLLEMDDDYGCMAAWYAMSAMGLYQVCPGKPRYNLTAPIFEKVTLHLDQRVYPGKTFTIKARNLNEKNIYIQMAKLNGKPYNQAFIPNDIIVAGGELVFEMGPMPNKRWGVE